ncbi:MAG TPA: class I SAM-dependent methyltransferase [Desulfosalsimonadaceae bacterium]|nr:class I SAM-dependent methyltransferase [Desulfosalsimonadaceae bacterium]
METTPCGQAGTSQNSRISERLIFLPKITPFERCSDAYDDWFRKNADAYAAELALIRGFLPLEAAYGMEVGAGSGKFAGPLGIRIGVEPSGEMAKKAVKQGVQVVRGVAENLPFADSAFDFVLMVTTICFVDNVFQSFSEARRVLKKGGRLIVGFVDRESELGRQYEAKREKSRFYREARFFSAREVLQCFNSSGFSIRKIAQTLIPGSHLNDMRQGYGQGAFVGVSGEK